MTKLIRIENADTGTGFRAVVEVVDVAQDGTETIANVIPLTHPTQMINTYITSTRYIRVKEITVE